MVAAEIGDQTSLISQAVMELVVTRIRDADVEWPPADFDLQWSKSQATRNAENIRRILTDRAVEMVVSGRRTALRMGAPVGIAGPLLNLRTHA